MADAPTIGALRKAGAITDAEVEAAVDAYLDYSDTTGFRIAQDYRLDLAAAVKAHPPSAVALTDPDRTDKFKRSMIRTAILLARPEKA